MVRGNRKAWAGMGEELLRYFAAKRWVCGEGQITWVELAVDFEITSGTLLPPAPRLRVGRERGYLGELSLDERAQEMRAATLRLGESDLWGAQQALPGQPGLQGRFAGMARVRAQCGAILAPDAPPGGVQDPPATPSAGHIQEHEGPAEGGQPGWAPGANR